MHFSANSCKKHATFACFRQKKLRVCATNLGKNRTFKIVRHEKSVNFADFRQSNRIYTQSVAKIKCS